jgi:ferrous-iron efflux pump FieF
MITVNSENKKLMKLATWASVTTAGILIFAKLLAWFMTGSVSILASLIDSIMDSLASLINLFAVHYSLQPADAEHRFGHGKAEPLAGLVQASFIGGSAIFLVLQAVDRLHYPHALEDVTTGIGVMVFAIIMTLGLQIIQRHVIKKTGSTAIRADALHYATDLLTNLSVILALFLASLGWAWADSVFAIGIAIYILYSAVRIGYEAFQILMDRELPAEIQGKIRTIAMSQPGVKGIHDLRTRQSGQTQFVQLHVELDKSLSLGEAHAIADSVEQAIRSALPGADVIVHEDPAGRTD